MACLNSTKAIAGMGIKGTDLVSLPDSGRAMPASENWMPRAPRPDPAPDKSRSMGSAIGVLRGGIRGTDKGC